MVVTLTISVISVANNIMTISAANNIMKISVANNIMIILVAINTSERVMLATRKMGVASRWEGSRAIVRLLKIKMKF